MDEGTKLVSCSCWILGYAAVMSIKGPLYLYTGKTFCNMVDYLNSLAFIQNWYGGFGIAFMRAVYIRNSSMFLTIEREVALFLGITSLAVTLGLNYCWYTIYTPTYPDFKPICLGRPMDDPLVHYHAGDTLSVKEFQIVLSILSSLTSSILLLEIILYFSIFKFLIDHDKMVKLVLSDSTIKKRMKRNAIDLFGHALLFAVDGCWLVIKIVETSSAKGGSPEALRYRRWAFKSIGMCMYGILSVIHIGFSSSLRADTIAIFKPLFRAIVVMLEKLFRPLIWIWTKCNPENYR